LLRVLRPVSRPSRNTAAVRALAKSRLPAGNLARKTRNVIAIAMQTE